MAYLKDITTSNKNDVQIDAGGRARVSQLTSLFDGKILVNDNVFTWDSIGTGGDSFSVNHSEMTTAADTQYRIRQAKRFGPYFSGKSQVCELTCDNLQHETGITKRVGYFSSSTTAPYTANFDGFFWESDGTDYRLKVYNNGSLIYSKLFTDMQGYEKLSSYDWSNFTVILFDFLWLGGAELRMFVKTDEGFIFLDEFVHAGQTTGTMMANPNQPVRYEIRQTGAGSGQLNAICSQISTEGSITEEGYNGSIDTGDTAITCTNVGTIYPILGIKKKAAHRNTSVKITSVDGQVTSNNDIVKWMVCLNPTTSAALTYNDETNQPIQKAVGDGTITVTNVNRVIAQGYLRQGNSIPSESLEKDYLAYLGTDIDANSEALVLCYMPLTASPATFGAINFKEQTN